MVSAWASQNRLVLGQVKVEDKSNEITAIPALLRVLALQGCVVTLGCYGLPGRNSCPNYHSENKLTIC